VSTTISVGTALTLLNLRRVGRKTAWQLSDRLANTPTDTADLQSMLREVAAEVPRFKAPSMEDLRAASERAARVQDEAAACGVGVLGPRDGGFPRSLLGIPDAPFVLFYKGNLEVLNAAKAVAVIGTRKPSEAGRKAASLISRRLADRSIVVVSGLALGCDAEAHTATVQAGGKGMAVLAHGLDTVSPASNKRLAASLLDKGGCLVSEYECGEKAQKQYFVDRDRLQSGLSNAVLLVEAADKSGSMHTVGFARLQDRPIAAVSFSDPQVPAAGNQFLLDRDEATPITTLASLEKWLTLVFPEGDNIESFESSPMPEASPVADDPNF
jgi:DNA processing protein